MRVKWVLKIGGSLGAPRDKMGESPLPSLLSMINRLSTNFKFLIIPGGGVYADFVRRSAAQKKTSESIAHMQATLACAQFGYELTAALEKGVVAHSRKEVEALWRDGKIPVFIPYPFVIGAKEIPQNWSATSDTIAIRVCISFGLNRLVLLKSVDGIFVDGKLMTEIRTDEMSNAIKGSWQKGSDNSKGNNENSHKGHDE